MYHFSNKRIIESNEPKKKRSYCMELIWKELDAERLVERQTVQVRVEGDLPTADGRTPKKVLNLNSRVIIDNAAVDTDKVDIEGQIRILTTALDEEDRAFSFESSAGFTHSVSASGVMPGMTAYVSPCVQSIDAVPSGSGLKLNVSMDMDVRITSAIPIKVTGGVSGIDDLEMKTSLCGHSRKLRIGQDTLRMREELAADAVADVLSAEGHVLVRDVSAEHDGTTVSGVISISAITADGNGHLGQLVRQVPFRERIGVSSTEDDVCCEAKLNSLYLRALGEDLALVSLETEVSFTLYAIKTSELSMPIDAFSPSIGFGCLCDKVDVLNSLGMLSAQTSIKETVPLPDGSADIRTPLFISARPIITEAYASGESITVNGILATTFTYESDSGLIYTFSEDVPFTNDIDGRMGANYADVKASCIASFNGIGERSIHVQYTLLTNADVYRQEEHDIVVGLVEKEPAEKMTGIIVCFASEGDEIFDIAKRYCVSCDSVKQLNPDMNAPFKEGDKLLLFI